METCVSLLSVTVVYSSGSLVFFLFAVYCVTMESRSFEMDRLCCEGGCDLARHPADDLD